MTKILKISLILCLVSLTTWGNSLENDLEIYKEEGVRQLKALISQNAWNDANGLSHKNRYVFSFLTREANKKGDWIEERPGGILLKESEFNSLSSRLNTYNNSENNPVKLYVCLAGKWPLTLKNKLDDQIEKTKDWQPDEKAEAQKKLKEKFTALVREIYNTVLNDIDQSSLYAVTNFVSKFNEDNKETTQSGFLKYFKVKNTVQGRENIKPSLTKISKSSFYNNINQNVEIIIETIRKVAGNDNADDSTGDETDDAEEIIVVHNGVEYRNSDEIFVNDETEEIVLEAKSDVVEMENASWEGAEGNGKQATLNIAETKVGDYEEVKVKVGSLETIVKIIKGSKAVKMTSIDKFFAPSVESLDIEYKITSDEIKYAKLEIFKNGDTQNPIYENKSLSVTGDNLKVSWDGKINLGNDKGNFVSIFDSPYTAKITVSKDEKYEENSSATNITKVELESITLTPNGKENLVKPTVTAIEVDKNIEASILIKNKQKNGVATSLPFAIHWSFEDPDDVSSNHAIDATGGAGNDNTSPVNGGKGVSSIMWKAIPGFVTRVSLNVAESDVNIIAPNIGKTKLQFSSSKIAGDNYILVAQIKNSSGVLFSEEKTNIWTVRKTVSFNNIYEMTGGLNMGTIMRVANINPAYSIDGCTDYSFGTLNTLPAGTDSPEFVAPLLPPIPLIDPLTGLPDPLTELPTAAELTDYASATAAVKATAEALINAKAQRWFARNMANLAPSLSGLVTSAAIVGPAIIGARYYHPKLDGRNASTTYYPAGILIEASGDPARYSMRVDPDDDWREVQGVADSSGNPWVFLNTSTPLRQQVVGRHEVGHVSDHIRFGGAASDHAPAGLMHYSADISAANPQGVLNFSDDSLNKLRGRN